MDYAVGLFDAHALIEGAGPWALLLVCAIVFVETGLLIGFLLPGDTLLIITGVLTFQGTIPQPIWLVSLAIFVASVMGNQTGYQIGKVGGPAVFSRREGGLISHASVQKTEAFFAKWGPLSVTFAQYVPIVRTLLPVAAGIGRMNRRQFTLYNALGSLLWAALLPFAGWLFAHIPGVAELVEQYIDVVLLGVVVIGVGYVIFHLWKERRTIQRESTSEGHDQ